MVTAITACFDPNSGLEETHSASAFDPAQNELHIATLTELI